MAKVEWKSLLATNWDSAMVLYKRLTIAEAQESARESLIWQLTRAAQTAFNNQLNALAQWRLQQARSLVKPTETNQRILETLQQIAALERSLSQ
jgi:hypothetical protein